MKSKFIAVILCSIALFVGMSMTMSPIPQNSGIIYHSNMYPDSVHATTSAFVTVDSLGFGGAPNTPAALRYKGDWVQVDVNINPLIDSIKILGLKFVNSTISEVSTTIPKGSSRIQIMMQSDTTAIVTVNSSTLGNHSYIQKYKSTDGQGQAFYIQYKSIGTAKYVNPYSIVATKFSQQ